MQRLIDWVKTHKLTTALLVIVVWLLWPTFTDTLLAPFSLQRSTSNYYGYDEMGSAPSAGYGSTSKSSESVSDLLFPVEPDAPPQTTSGDRLVIKDTTLSLLVKNVSEVQNQVIQKAVTLGGYMVSSSLHNPQDDATATVVVRIPTKSLDTALDYYRGLAIKVTSENLSGHDVTDQYIDIDKHLASLYETKRRMEEIRDKAETVEELLNVQTQLTNIQRQIDSYVGQQQSLKQNAELSKVTLYLATDEISLPYTPSQKFRPEVIFKLAYRSLLDTLINWGERVIWITVYSVIWGPIVLALLVYRRRRRQQQAAPKKKV